VGFDTGGWEMEGHKRCSSFHEEGYMERYLQFLPLASARDHMGFEVIVPGPVEKRGHELGR